MRRAGMTIAALIAVGAFATAAGAATSERGKFETLPAGTTMGLSLEGTVKITRTADGTTVRIVVRGLEPGTTYGAHLHSSPCSVNEGGSHYKNDPAGASTPPNELWLSTTDDPLAGITANAGGVAVASGSADWVARAEADAVVIHAIPSGGTPASGPKIACADLG